ncbi:NUDIX domain-containing protein [Legionella brunensis]|uniref:ADP-ribose pyrophosphatase n=1 Tax=Legionella brunensis TaxID=29422 RepID=A0A0W0SU62_9GAMM|nr:NUDIX domain-containing protein [Legionella brunensis]KTC86880.1 NUDIX hydrolase [Legionella brunensis]
MSRKAKYTLKEKSYEGYLKITKYDLEIPSFNSSIAFIKATNRELVHSADSILVLIYVPENDSFLLCQEFRIGVYFNDSQDDPFILECVSGTIDKNSGPEETARKEVFEETGLSVKRLIPIAITYKSPGLMTEKCYIYYTEVAGIPKTGIYGVQGEEEIKTQLVMRAKVYQLMDEMAIKDSATLIALNWFRAAKG